MFIFKVFLILITLCVAKSELDHKTMCKNDFRDEKNNRIDVLEYCSDKLCIEKCCGPNEMLSSGSQCISMEKFYRITKRHRYLVSQYNSTNILTSFNIPETAKNNTVFVQNKRNSVYLIKCTAMRDETEIYVISENGTLEIQEASGSKSTVEKLHYCIDTNVKRIQEKPKRILKVTIVLRQITEDSTEKAKIRQFENIGLMISSSFLVCVLIVYCLLPNLRNLTGLILMAYMLTLLVGFIAKFILDFILKQTKPPDNICQIMTPIVYFGFVSSIFWLSVYAFDVFWGLRGFRIKRNSRHGKMAKFMWYALYAWGIPLLLTSIIVVLDNLPYLNLAVQTPFKNCLGNGDPLDYYYKIPIGILILINIVLFFMTVYNIWMVKQAVNKCNDSGRSKQQSKFATYAKLFLMMGVGWCMELLPPGDDIWIYVVVNLYNLLTGVTIFYLFICKKTILLQLCKKFNVPNRIINYLGLERSHTRTESGITRSTCVSSTIRRRSKDPVEDIPLEKTGQVRIGFAL